MRRFAGQGMRPRTAGRARRGRRAQLLTRGAGSSVTGRGFYVWDEDHRSAQLWGRELRDMDAPPASGSGEGEDGGGST